MSDTPPTRGLIVEGLSKSTGEPPRILFTDMTFTITPGDCLAIVCADREALTSLAEVLAAIIPADAGKVRLQGATVIDGNQSASNLYRNKGIAFLQQDPDLVGHCSVFENVTLPTLVTMHDTTGPDRARTALKIVSMQAHEKTVASTLSPTDAFRVAIARAMVNKPPCWICEETGADLPDADRDSLLEIIIALAKEDGRALLYLTQNPDIATAFPHVRYLCDGQLSDEKGSA